MKIFLLSLFCLVSVLLCLCFCVRRAETKKKAQININLEVLPSGIKNYLCNTDSDCFNSNSFCHGGFCRTIGYTPNARPDIDINCNHAKGIYPVLTTTGNQLVWKCKSFYLYLWNDDGSKRGGVCDNGNLETNVIDHAPTIKDCICNENHTLYSLGISNIPQCINKNVEHLFGPDFGTKQV